MRRIIFLSSKFTVGQSVLVNSKLLVFEWTVVNVFIFKHGVGTGDWCGSLS